MEWPNLAQSLELIKLPTNYEVEQLSRPDVDKLISLLKRWYPDITVGGESRHLNPSFYINENYLTDEDKTRDLFPVIVKYDGEIIAYVSFQKNSGGLSLTSPMGVVAPDHRKSGISVLGWGLIEALGRLMGAELLYAYVTLKIPHQQVLAKKYGFKLVGIIPGNDRDMVRPGEIRRVYEAIYTKLLCADEILEKPDSKCLTEETKKLWSDLNF